MDEERLKDVGEGNKEEEDGGNQPPPIEGLDNGEDDEKDNAQKEDGGEDVAAGKGEEGTGAPEGACVCAFLFYDTDEFCDAQILSSSTPPLLNFTRKFVVSQTRYILLKIKRTS